jgi:hypothetical protein
MNITTVCSHCRNHDKEPNLEINFKDGVIYYVCPECKKESKIMLKAEGKALPKLKRI